MGLERERAGGEVVPSLLRGIKNIGITKGDLVIVHSSFKSMGLSGYGPADAVATLLESVGPEGTVMMPAFTYSYSGIWGVKPFNPDTTPGHGNGVLSETFRKHPGVLRSGHPAYSVAARGRYAGILTENRENASALGEGSSYGEAKRLGAKILLIGVGSNRNSMLHHAEAAAGLPYNDIPFRAFWGDTALVEGKDGRAAEIPLVREFPACSDNFGVIDGYLSGRGVLRRGKLKEAESLVMDSRELVGAVIKKLHEEPGCLLCGSITCEPCSLRKKRLSEKGLL